MELSGVEPWVFPSVSKLQRAEIGESFVLFENLASGGEQGILLFYVDICDWYFPLSSPNDTHTGLQQSNSRDFDDWGG